MTTITENPSTMLSDPEVRTIILSACSTRPHTEGELIDLIRWAELTRLDQILLDHVLNGRVKVEWMGDQPQFKKTMNNSINNGGPAFPVPPTYNPDGSVWYHGETGLTMRDWFAGMALSGMMSYHNNERGDFHTNCDDETIAGCAYSYADAMLEARQKGGEP